MSLSDAQRMFAENVNLVSPHGNKPERMLQWNLNSGLYQMAQSLRALESEVEALRHEVQRLRRSH